MREQFLTRTVFQLIVLLASCFFGIYLFLNKLKHWFFKQLGSYLSVIWIGRFWNSQHIQFVQSEVYMACDGAPSNHINKCVQ